MAQDLMIITDTDSQLDLTQSHNSVGEGDFTFPPHVYSKLAGWLRQVL